MHFRVLKEAHIALIELLAGRSRRRARERVAVVVFFMPAHIALLYCYIGYICLSQYYIHSRRSKCVTIPRILLQIFHIYFDTSTYDEVEKDVKVTMEGMLGVVGGTMGLLNGNRSNYQCISIWK